MGTENKAEKLKYKILLNIPGRMLICLLVSFWLILKSLKQNPVDVNTLFSEFKLGYSYNTLATW